MWRAKQKELKKWEGRADYDGVILLKSDKRPECWNVLEDPELNQVSNNPFCSATMFAIAAGTIKDQYDFGHFDELEGSGY